PQPVVSAPVEVTTQPELPKLSSGVATKATSPSAPTPSEPEIKQEPQEVSRLKQELEVSESELLALEERNHQLRLMLSE
ncbi:hypothetical protein ACPV5V_33030, partial [Vibrio campbellii]